MPGCELEPAIRIDKLLCWSALFEVLMDIFMDMKFVFILRDSIMSFWKTNSNDSRNSTHHSIGGFEGFRTND